jgi:hypothetical protein
LSQTVSAERISQTGSADRIIPTGSAERMIHAVSAECMIQTGSAARMIQTMHRIQAHRHRTLHSSTHSHRTGFQLTCQLTANKQCSSSHSSSQASHSIQACIQHTDCEDYDSHGQGRSDCLSKARGSARERRCEGRRGARGDQSEFRYHGIWLGLYLVYPYLPPEALRASGG